VARFSDEYGRVFGVSRVRESATRTYKHGVPEQVLRCIWYDRLFRGEDIRTFDGRTVEVLSPGRWNFEEGPDFRDAVVSFAGQEIVAGDVEIDMTVSDWHAHGHDRDPNHAGTILLVVLETPTGRVVPTKTQGVTVPVLVLRDYLDDTLEKLSGQLDPRDYPFGKATNLGACAQPRDVDTLCRVIDMAADWRVISKAKQFAKDIQEKGLEQAFHEGFMTALGYKRLKDQFRQVAARAGVEQLRLALAECEEDDRVEVAEALLLHAAGLIPDESKTREWDDESLEHYRKVRQGADQAPPPPDCLADPILWRFAGVRPQNYPARRLAGAAHVIAANIETGLAKRCLDLWGEASGTREDTAAFAALFTDSSDCYWTRRYTWGGNKTNKPTALIGEGRAAQVVVNVVIPFSLAVARDNRDLNLESKVFATYLASPPLPTNDVLRLMAYRLFGTDPPRPLIRNARRQQGLIQIYQDWCSEDPLCQQCSILPLLTA
jgi:hypothetical protein